jgi:hypothetical protein
MLTLPALWQSPAETDTIGPSFIGSLVHFTGLETPP